MNIHKRKHSVEPIKTIQTKKTKSETKDSVSYVHKSKSSKSESLWGASLPLRPAQRAHSVTVGTKGSLRGASLPQAVQDSSTAAGASLGTFDYEALLQQERMVEEAKESRYARLLRPMGRPLDGLVCAMLLRLFYDDFFLR